MADNSFDVVSKIELPEVSNAIQQALKEILQRYDLKDSKSTIELNEKDGKILLASSDDFKLKAGVFDQLENEITLLVRGLPRFVVRTIDCWAVGGCLRWWSLLR